MTTKTNQSYEKRRKWPLLLVAILLLGIAILFARKTQEEPNEITEPALMKEKDAAEVTAPSLEEQNTKKSTEVSEVAEEIENVKIVEAITETTPPSVEEAPAPEIVFPGDITTSTTETNPTPEYNESYIGQFKIPSLGINVGCYEGSTQGTVDKANSAAYFNHAGHVVIADHVNQDFSSLKSCKKGDIAHVPVGNDSIQYECVAVMDGINTGYSLTTTDGRSISELYPGTVVCYTCNGNSTNVTMAFFKIVESTSNNNNNNPINQIEDKLYTEPESDTEEVWLNPSPNGKEPCPANTHKWYLFHTVEFWETEGEYEVKYFHEQYVCSTCDSDMLRTTEVERVPIKNEEIEPPEESKTPSEESTEPTLPSEPDTNHPESENTEPPIDNSSEINSSEPPRPEETESFLDSENETETTTEATTEVDDETVSS